MKNPIKRLFVIMLCFGLFISSRAQSNVAHDILDIAGDIVTLLNTTQPAQKSILNLYNNTNNDIYFALAYYDNQNQCWSTKGWYFVKAYATRNIDFGGYTGKMYIHGYRKAFWGLSEDDWGSGYSFCIDKTGAFEIRNADKISCDKRGDFSEYNLAPGENKWTFNP